MPSVWILFAGLGLTLIASLVVGKIERHGDGATWTVASFGIAASLGMAMVVHWASVQALRAESRSRRQLEDLHRLTGELRGEIETRKESEDSLRLAAARYRGIFENALEGIYQSTPSGRYIRVNPALARMYGYESSSKLIDSVADIEKEIYVEPGVRERFRKQVEQKGEVSGLEYQVRRRDGTVIWISEFARVVRDERGVVQYYEGTIHNITRRKEIEEEKTRLEAQVRQSQKMEAIGTLAGGIAHDFNNILGAIIGFTELSLDDVPDQSVTQKNLQNVLVASRRARELVRQILSYSRQTPLHYYSVALGPLAGETMKFIRATLPSTIEIATQLNLHRDSIIADPTQIQQVLMNLCSNAGYAMREKGGKLQIQLSEAPVKPADAPPGVKSGPFLKLSVSDTGHGMAPEVLDRIFDPFFTTKAVGEGTGLGLAVAQGIITNHGGWISVESELGKGTTFHVFLPLSDTEVAPPDDLPSETVGGRERILYIDDEEDLVNVAQQRLHRLGYRVSTKSDSQEALLAFRANPDWFDLIITDHTMPGLTGVELSREIRQIRPEIPIILNTGCSLRLDSDEVGKVGFDGVLLKPVDFNQLGGLIRQALVSRNGGRLKHHD